MNLTRFKDNLSKYSSYYNPAALFEKIKGVAKKVGVKIVYLVLILYYATLDKGLPIKDRLMVIAALGYFILPADLIPDAIPGGFADDTAALMYVLSHIWKNLTPETKRKARERLTEWFGEVPDSELHIPGL